MQTSSSSFDHFARSATGLALVLGLGACIGTNPDWDPPPIGGGGGESGSLDTDDTETDGVDTDEGDPLPDIPEADDGGIELFCGEGLPATGKCPIGCDDCSDGVCWRICETDDCQATTFECPDGWPCRIVCTNEESCKDAVFHCNGGGACELDCSADQACHHARLECADGPCDVECDPNYYDACDHLTVVCGHNETRINCSAPVEGHGPTIEGSPLSCSCVNDCTVLEGGGDDD